MLEIIHQILKKENQKNFRDTTDTYKSDSILRTNPHLSSKHIESTLLTELEQILKTIKGLKKNQIWKKEENDF